MNSYMTVLSLEKGIEVFKQSIDSGFMETAAHQTFLMGNTGVYLDARGHVLFALHLGWAVT